MLGDMKLDAFETDWQRQWLVERGLEIISEASRRLPDEIKAKHPEIPWPKVAGIGNVLRHNYENSSPKTCRISIEYAAKSWRGNQHANFSLAK